MDQIKKQKLETMNKYKKSQFLDNLICCCSIALTCILFCSSPLWLPPIYFFFKTLLFVYLPCVFNPKFLFVLCNIIVVFLIGESKLVGSRAVHATDIYDEYVSKSNVCRSKSPASPPLIKKEAYESVKCEEIVEEGNYHGKEKLELPAEELNKRVEDFIARVNKQRRLEAELLLDTSD